MTWTQPPLRRIVYRVPCTQEGCLAPVGAPCRGQYTHIVRITAENALTASRVAAVRAACDPTGSTGGSEQLALVPLEQLPQH